MTMPVGGAGPGPGTTTEQPPQNQPPQQQQVPPAAQPPPAQQQLPQTVPLPVLLEEREKRQAAEKSAADNAAKLKAIEQAQMSEADKAKAHLAELTPKAAKADRAEAWGKAQLDAALKKLPAEQLEKAKTVVGKMDPFDALDALEAFGLTAPKDPKRTPPADGSPPAARVEGAPRTYSEWVAMPEGPEKAKHRRLASTLPD